MFARICQQVSCQQMIKFLWRAEHVDYAMRSQAVSHNTNRGPNVVLCTVIYTTINATESFRVRIFLVFTTLSCIKQAKSNDDTGNVRFIYATQHQMLENCEL